MDLDRCVELFCVWKFIIICQNLRTNPPPFCIVLFSDANFSQRKKNKSFFNEETPLTAYLFMSPFEFIQNQG